MAASLLAAGILLAPRPAPGQEDSAPPTEGSGWNSPRALELARSASEARRRARERGGLESYTARAEGHVYFLAEFAGERQLVRADQVALRIYWQGPGRALQTIVGRRHENRLPTRIRYHIDHLAVVLDNFDDRIRLGEGDEVRHVLHPAADGALAHYDYRLADSLEIRIHDRPVRVYRLQVRPSRPGAPGVVGSLFVERGSGAIARMTLTFTSSAYVDRDLDYIHLDLRSALWEGTHWLPAEQELEIRREVSWLSFPVGGVIRTRFRIFDYRLGEAPAFALPPGERVASLPAGELREYRGWEEPLHAGPLADAESSDEALARVRARARELVTPRALMGTSRLQLHFPNASGVLRARRAEGLLAGAGARYRPDDRTAIAAWVGYPFGRERPEAEAEYRRTFGSGELRAALFHHRLSDIGPFPAASGILSTLAFALHGEDYTDPYFQSGVEAELAGSVAGGRGSVGLLVAAHDSAGLAALSLGGTPRPVRPVREGTLAELSASFRRPLGRALGAEWEAGLQALGATQRVGDFGFTRLLVHLRADGGDAGSPWDWEADAWAGTGGGELPPQRLFLLGGRGTVPGYPFRTWGGDRMVRLRGEVSRDAVPPWLRLRLQLAAGWAEPGDAGRSAAELLGLGGSGGLRPAAGIGAGLFYDILRLDLARGLDGGEWVVLLSFHRSFWPIL